MGFSLPNIGGSAGQAFQNAKNSFNPSNPTGFLGAGTGAVLGTALAGPAGGIFGAKAGSNLFNGVSNQLFGSPQDAPAAPGVNPNLQTLQQQQLQNAASFRAGIPGMSNQLGQNLAVANNEQTSKQINNVTNNNNARGLLYGGVNAGQKAEVRSANQKNLAQGQSDINANLKNQAAALDQQAIQTGVGIQKTQQTIQDQIYSQALAQMQAQNAGFGSLMQAGGMAAGAALV